MMGNDRIQRIIWDLGLAVLLGGFVVVALPSPPAAAQQRISEEQCERELAAFTRRSGISPSKEVYGRAVSYCRRGDLRGAVAMIEKGK